MYAMREKKKLYIYTYIVIYMYGGKALASVYKMETPARAAHSNHGQVRPGAQPPVEAHNSPLPLHLHFPSHNSVSKWLKRPNASPPTESCVALPKQDVSEADILQGGGGGL